MGALKVVGGILALAGSGLMLALIIMSGLGGGFGLSHFLVMILPILALIGGILALAGKRAGGVLALIVGIIWVLFAVFANLGILVGDLPLELIYILLPQVGLSFFLVYVGFTIWGFLTVEVLLVFVGGILATAGGGD